MAAIKAFNGLAGFAYWLSALSSGLLHRLQTGRHLVIDDAGHFGASVSRSVQIVVGGVFTVYRVRMLDRDTKQLLIGFALLLLFAIATVCATRSFG
jgi:hypothetical protein